MQRIITQLLLHASDIMYIPLYSPQCLAILNLICSLVPMVKDMDNSLNSWNCRNSSVLNNQRQKSKYILQGREVIITITFFATTLYAKSVSVKKNTSMLYSICLINSFLSSRKVYFVKIHF